MKTAGDISSFSFNVSIFPFIAWPESEVLLYSMDDNLDDSKQYRAKEYMVDLEKYFRNERRTGSIQMKHNEEELNLELGFLPTSF